MENLSENNRYIKIAEDLYDGYILNRNILHKIPFKHNFTIDLSKDFFDDTYDEIKEYFENQFFVPEYFKNNAEYNCYFITLYNLDNSVLTDENISNKEEEFKNEYNKRKTNFTKNLLMNNNEKRYLNIKAYCYYYDIFCDCCKAFEEEYNHLKTFRGLTFDELWEYCQFVRWAEKVLFYDDNSKDSELFVDTQLKAEDRRLFSITQNKTKLYFELSYIPSNNIFSDESDLKNITISIERDYGKHYNNKYNITNSVINYTDDSDLYLINTINIILNQVLSENFYRIITKLFSPDFEFYK